MEKRKFVEFKKNTLYLKYFKNTKKIKKRKRLFWFRKPFWIRKIRT